MNGGQENNELDETLVNNIIYNESILSGKIHHSLEDPISQLFYDISDRISPYLYKIGITPNMITLQRFIVFTVGFIYFFEQKKYKEAAAIYMYAYFCDCLDGQLARKYSMETTFGDYFDHIVDILTIVISIYFIAKSINEEYQWILFIILLLLALSLVQLGCQERYLEMTNINSDSYSISSVKCMCPHSLVSNSEIENVMEVTKFFGTGIYHLFIMILIWNFESLN